MPIELTHDLRHEVTDFLVKEAWLLDDRRFHEWLELFTDDLVYWMPQRTNRLRKDQDKEVNDENAIGLFDDTLETLRIRVARLDTGMAWAEDPPSRTRHTVTNVLVEATESDSEIRVRSAFIVYRTRLEYDEDWFVGSKDDILRKVDGDWKIARRTMMVDQAVLLAKNMSIFF